MTMNWLKSEICHAHGYSAPVYTYIKGQDLEDVKYEIRHGPDGDRDRFREPRWTLLETLPPEILAQKIKEANGLIESGRWWLTELTGVAPQEADALREVTFEAWYEKHTGEPVTVASARFYGLTKKAALAKAAWDARAALAPHQPQQGEQHE